MNIRKVLNTIAPLSCIFSLSMANGYAAENDEEDANNANLCQQLSFVFVRDSNDKFLIQEVPEPFNDSVRVIRTAPVFALVNIEEGESEYEAAVSACAKQAEFTVTKDDLHLFATVFEKNYSAEGVDFILYLFECKKHIETPAPASFSLSSRDEITEIIEQDNDVDRKAMWEFYDKYKDTTVMAKAEFYSHKDPNKGPDITIKEDL